MASRSTTTPIPIVDRESSRAPEAKRDRRRRDRERRPQPDERQAGDAQQRDDKAGVAMLVRGPDDAAEQRCAEEEDRWILQSRIVSKQVVDRHRSQTKRDAGARQRPLDPRQRPRERLEELICRLRETGDH